MSSVSRINGFRPVKTLDGKPWTGACNTYFVPSSDATAIYIGDPVKLAGDARSASGVPTVTIGGTGAAIVGFVVGVAFEGVGDLPNIPPVTNLNAPIYRAASTNAYLLVADDPQLIFEAETSGATFATADVSLNASFAIGTPSTTTGASGATIDLSTKATTANLVLKIVGFPNRPDNAIGDSYTRAYVSINNHSYKGGTGTVGV